MRKLIYCFISPVILAVLFFGLYRAVGKPTTVLGYVGAVAAFAFAAWKVAFVAVNLCENVLVPPERRSGLNPIWLIFLFMFYFLLPLLPITAVIVALIGGGQLFVIVFANIFALVTSAFLIAVS